MVTAVPLHGLQRGRAASVPVPPLSALPQFPHLHSVRWQWGGGDSIPSPCHRSDPAPNPAPTAVQPVQLLLAALGCTAQWSRLAPGVVLGTVGGSGLHPHRGPTAGWGPLSPWHCHVAMGARHHRGHRWGSVVHNLPWHSLARGAAAWLCFGTTLAQLGTARQLDVALEGLWHQFGTTLYLGTPQSGSMAPWVWPTWRGCGRRGRGRDGWAWFGRG